MAEYTLTFEATITLEDPVPEAEVPSDVLLANFRAQAPALVLLRAERTA